MSEHSDKMMAESGYTIREKATGRAMAEVSLAFPIHKLNTDKYEAVKTLQHLYEVNDPSTLAYRAVREPLTRPL